MASGFSAAVKCDSDNTFIKRADYENLRQVFNKYASIQRGDSHYMTPVDFAVKYLKLFDEDNYNIDSINLLCGVVDTSKDGYISFEEFQGFEALLCSTDALYATAFQMFDQNGNGYITFEEFKNVISSTTLHEHVPFNFKSDFIDLHFGKKRNRLINYNEFTKFIHDFHEEHALQAFRRFDRDGNGTISIVDFNQIMVLLKSYLLTPFVRENLVYVAEVGEKQRRISFTYFSAFISLLDNMELVKKIYSSRSGGLFVSPITKDEFINEAQHFTQLTPMEIEILFHLVNLTHKDGSINYKDIVKIAPIGDESMTYHLQARALQDTVDKEAEGKGRTVFISILEQLYRFTLAAISGAVGATAVYPIDLVKTRMQNQRSGSMIGELMYKNSWDCFKKVLRFEGFFGLYRGLAPQLVGVAPEKAIKLTMNDFMKDQLTTPAGEISILSEVISGGLAGGSQVIFTNPLEIVKIRLQVAGEIVTTKRISAWMVVRDLGFMGLYKGARACFLRDIPFSAVYFPGYTHLKILFADENGYNNPGTLLLAATCAGAPAAYLTTPADVIKTRLQVEARKGQTSYSGVMDAARKIFKEEGFKAFWKGAPARVFRSSPQFGVTLSVYELLQRALKVDFGGRKLAGSKTPTRLEEMLPANPDHIGGYRVARVTFDGMESKFGICLPKYKLS